MHQTLFVTALLGCLVTDGAHRLNPPEVAVRPPWRWSELGAAITAVSIGLTWAAHGLSSVCPAVLPVPPSCYPGARFFPAVLGSVVLVVLFAALLLAVAMIRSGYRDGTLLIVLIVIVIASVVVPLWTLTASGFVIPFTVSA
jgi:hypothetical protein